MNYAVHLTLKSSNSKVGPIPVSTTTKATCPDDCPLKANGCYADGGPISILWNKVSNGRDPHALSWGAFCEAIGALPHGQLWRHNQAGDLPGHNNAIDKRALIALVAANYGRRGFTYTHKPMTNANRAAVQHANMAGFTINLSADTLAEADKLADLDIAPVCVILPQELEGTRAPVTTPAGRTVAICPATYMDTSCADCQLCQRRNRRVVVGFPAHGASKRKATTVANGG